MAHGEIPLDKGGKQGLHSTVTLAPDEVSLFEIVRVVKAKGWGEFIGKVKEGKIVMVREIKDHQLKV
mgnify:CR=1 FL=1